MEADTNRRLSWRRGSYRRYGGGPSLRLQPRLLPPGWRGGGSSQLPRRRPAEGRGLAGRRAGAGRGQGLLCSGGRGGGQRVVHLDGDRRTPGWFIHEEALQGLRPAYRADDKHNGGRLHRLRVSTGVLSFSLPHGVHRHVTAQFDSAGSYYLRLVFLRGCENFLERSVKPYRKRKMPKCKDKTTMRERAV